MATMGPMKTLLNSVKKELKAYNKINPHWSSTGIRSVAVAVTLLQNNLIIATPTDTIYGLAGIASRNESIEMIYKIKKRDPYKPLSISVSNVNDIKTWAITDHLSPNLLTAILPGQYTVILKRTPALNPALNSNCDTVGIRVPQLKFLTNVSRLTGPLVLTSANESNKPNCLCPMEFQNLWPSLGGIFYENKHHCNPQEHLRRGSTIVDLSLPGCYKIVRSGSRVKHLCGILEGFGLRKS